MSNDTHDIKVSKFTQTIVDFIEHHPYLTVLFSLAMVVGFTAGAPKLVADFTHRGYFYDTDPQLMAFDAFERRFGNDDAVVVGVHSPSGIFDVESAKLLQELTSGMWLVPEIIRVDSLANFNWVHADGDEIQVEPFFPEALTPELLQERQKIALAHEVLPDYLISKDSKTALIFARIKPGIDAPPNAPAITAAVHALVKKLTGGDHTFHILGGPPLTAAFTEVATSDTSVLFPAAILIACIFLAYAMRSVAGVLLSLTVVFLTIAATFGFAGWADIVLTNMSTAVPSIMIATCIADSAHILMSFFEAKKRGLSRKEAARYSLKKNFLPTFLTSFTTALGFVSFASADMKPVAGLGAMAGFGAQFAWVLTLGIIGPLLFVLPIKAGKLAPESAASDNALAERFTQFIGRHRRVVMVSVAVLSVVSLWVSATNEINSDPLKYFSKNVPVRLASEFVEAQVGGANAVEVVIDTGVEDGIKDPEFLKKIEALQAWIEEQPGVTRVVSILDVLKSMNRSLNGDKQEFYRLAADKETIGQELFLYSMSLPQGMDLNDRVTIKNDALRLTVMSKLATSREFMNNLYAIEARGKEMGLNAHVTGKARLYNGMNEYVVESFLWSLGTASLSIGLIMVLFLRSLSLGLVAMLPNIVPVLIGGAFLRIINQPLDLGTVIVASVSLGIAVDDTVHILANFKRFRAEGMSKNEAMQATFSATGRVLFATTSILTLSFASFAFADFTPNFYFGVLTAVTLTVALLTDMFLTSAVLMEPVAKDGKGAAASEPARAAS